MNVSPSKRTHKMYVQELAEESFAVLTLQDIAASIQ